ncbi:MAG: VOC family protein [Halofilum sp. (in: g-proteobacteria)]|nr:VOC family protein [Halofilum sp. (in: g-proteobacteria)]
MQQPRPGGKDYHQDQLGAIVIDCQGDIDAAGTFWSGVFGYTVTSAADDPKYRRLESPPGEVDMLLQDVAHASRVHLDIETNDIEAEAARLEGLGARRVERIRDWLVMEAPTGHRFCLVAPQRPTSTARTGRDAQRGAGRSSPATQR